MSSTFLADSILACSGMSPKVWADHEFWLGSTRVSSSVTLSLKAFPLGAPWARNNRAPPGSTRTGSSLASETMLSNPVPATSQLASQASTTKPSWTFLRYSGSFTLSAKSALEFGTISEKVTLVPSANSPFLTFTAGTPASS